MAIQHPTSPLTVPAKSEFSKVLGLKNIVPTTGSYYETPIVEIINDVCDYSMYKSFSANMSIIELVNCEKVAAGNITIRGRVPYTANEGSVSFEALNNFLASEISTELDATN